MRMLMILSTLLPLAASAQTPLADRALELTVTEQYRIGGGAAPEWATLVDVRAVAFGPSGELWVADLRGAQVLRIAPDGRSGRSVARRGRGPGEVQAPLLIAVTADGRALVGDLLNTNLQLLASDGELIATVPARGELRRLNAIAWLDGDDFIGTPTVFTMDGQPRIMTANGDEPATAIPILRFSAAASSTARRVAAGRLTAPPKRTEPLTPHGFPTRLLWTAHAGNIAYADGPEYDVHVLDATGQQAGRVRRAIAPREPSRADISAARAEARARLITGDGRPRVASFGVGGGSGPSTADMLKRVERALDDMTFADRVPTLQGLRYDMEGRLWAARTADVWGKPPLLDVFSPSGTYLGTSSALPRLPDAFGPDGLVAFIERDDLDVPVIIVKKVTLEQAAGRA